MARKAIAIGSTTDQIKILHTIPQAISQVSDETAVQIEAMASQVIEDAQLVATKVRELALAIREHGRIATENVAKHCARTKHTLDTVARLQSGLTDDTVLVIDGAEHLPEAGQLMMPNNDVDSTS